MQKTTEKNTQKITKKITPPLKNSCELHRQWRFQNNNFLARA